MLLTARPFLLGAWWGRFRAGAEKGPPGGCADALQKECTAAGTAVPAAGRKRQNGLP